MSQENVEVVRRHIDAFRQDDVPQALSQLDPYVALDWSRGRHLGLTVAYGHEEVTQTVRHWIGAFEDYDYGVERAYRPRLWCGLVIVAEEGRGKSSGVPVRQSFAVLYTVIDGKIGPAHRLSRRGTGPRSHRPLGVGDVAGERGGRASRL